MTAIRLCTSNSFTYRPSSAVNESNTSDGSSSRSLKFKFLESTKQSIKLDSGLKLVELLSDSVLYFLFFNNRPSAGSSPRYNKQHETMKEDIQRENLNSSLL